MALETEQEYYKEQKVELLKHYEGQFALIVGSRLAGTFTTHREAFNAGVEQFGNVAFLIQQVQERDEVIQYPSLAIGLISANS